MYGQTRHFPATVKFIGYLSIQENMSIHHPNIQTRLAVLPLVSFPIAKIRYSNETPIGYLMVHEYTFYFVIQRYMKAQRDTHLPRITLHDCRPGVPFEYPL